MVIQKYNYGIKLFHVILKLDQTLAKIIKDYNKNYTIFF